MGSVVCFLGVRKGASTIQGRLAPSLHERPGQRHSASSQLAPMPSAPGSIAPCWCSRSALLATQEWHEATRELWRSSLSKIRNQFARRLWWIPLSAHSKADSLNDRTLLLPEYRDEVVVGGHYGDTSFSQPVQREVAMIASNEHINLTRQARGSVNPVIRVRRQRFCVSRWRDRRQPSRRATPHGLREVADARRSPRGRLPPEDDGGCCREDGGTATPRPRTGDRHTAE
jgi:hypothetical protein